MNIQDEIVSKLSNLGCKMIRFAEENAYREMIQFTDMEATERKKFAEYVVKKIFTPNITLNEDLDDFFDNEKEITKGGEILLESGLSSTKVKEAIVFSLDDQRQFNERALLFYVNELLKPQLYEQFANSYGTRVELTDLIFCQEIGLGQAYEISKNVKEFRHFQDFLNVSRRVFNLHHEVSYSILKREIYNRQV